jgi:CheY-like chemotaxis protein
MSKEFMEKLFEPFSRAQDDRIRKVQGTGLGMAISRNIVNMMGGNIEVESEVNKGTKFIVTFFLKLGDLEMKTEGELSGKKAVNRGAARPETMPLQNFEDMDLSGYRVLLVEDNELNVEITTEILEMTGITVDVANDGSEAVDMIRERGDIKYDLILMDIQMPKMNGYDATRAIRNLGCDFCKSVPIIAMTANAFAEDVQAAFSAGMNEHIAKPLDLKALAGVLDKWVLGKNN